MPIDLIPAADDVRGISRPPRAKQGRYFRARATGNPVREAGNEIKEAAESTSDTGTPFGIAEKFRIARSFLWHDKYRNECSFVIQFFIHGVHPPFPIKITPFHPAI